MAKTILNIGEAAVDVALFAERQKLAVQYGTVGLMRCCRIL